MPRRTSGGRGLTDLTFFLAAYIFGAFVLAGLVKGVTGMGLPTLAMALLGGVMAPVAAAALLVVPSFVTNVWQLAAGPAFGALARRLWPMMAGILVGTVAASSLIAGGDVRWTTAGLGATLVAYALHTLLGWQLSVPARVEPWLSPLVGLATGAITGGTGVFVVPAVPYLQALGFDRDELVQALGLSFTVSTVALAVGLAWHGGFEGGNLTVSALAILPALGGMWIGQRVRQRIAPATFRRWFLISLIVLGTELLTRPFR